MIYVNQQLKNKVYKSHKDMYPKLYYTDFEGKCRQIKHIDIELSGGEVYIQSDITDCGQLQRETEKRLYAMLESAQKKLAEAQEVINTIQKVMEG